MTVRPIVVFKIGGSLLDLPDLGDVVRELLAQRPEHASLLAAGGGAAADVVREWDCVHRLGEEISHELALQAMTLNEALLVHLLPEVRLARNRKQFEAIAAARQTALLCSHCFIRWAESQPAAGLPEALPHTWQVTSDSIAAWAALCLQAEELVLVKSAPKPAGRSAREAAADGLVDAHFPQLASKLPLVSWVNLRSDNRLMEPWLQSALPH